MSSPRHAGSPGRSPSPSRSQGRFSPRRHSPKQSRYVLPRGRLPAGGLSVSASYGLTVSSSRSLHLWAVPAAEGSMHEMLHNTKISCVSAGEMGLLAAGQQGGVYFWEAGGGFEDSEAEAHAGVAIPILRPLRSLAGYVVATVSVGWEHAMITASTGELFTWGNGDGGRLGHGDEESLISPRMVNSLSHCTCTQISAGFSSSMALTTIRAVFSWGLMFNGIRHKPQQVQALENHAVAEVACGHGAMFVLTLTGKLLSWGWGVNGQLGLGSMANVHTPTPVTSEDFADKPGCGVIQVKAGYHTTVAVTEDRSVWTWGLDDRQGCLGLGKGVIDVWVPTQVPGVKNVDEIAVSMNPSSCSVVAWHKGHRSDGSLHRWGSGFGSKPRCEVLVSSASVGSASSPSQARLASAAVYRRRSEVSESQTFTRG